MAAWPQRQALRVQAKLQARQLKVLLPQAFRQQVGLPPPAAVLVLPQGLVLPVQAGSRGRRQRKYKSPKAALLLRQSLPKAGSYCQVEGQPSKHSYAQGVRISRFTYGKKTLS